ncbi:hypothetical protein BJ878DRAFT_275853 [Calycina marina]|uniref:Uncharacterized protein n=1 Tax=Calycina marina TaxID=1763456 RepID=A0A9P7Z7H4_9HELO|nr:hypothetical protein BJ878DRAFT_275853 [Calycina marina]
MDTIYRLMGMLTPKRPRTVGPGTNTHEQNASGVHSYLPMSEPHDRKTSASLQLRIERKQVVPVDRRFGPGSRKRDRDEDDDSIGEADSESEDEMVDASEEIYNSTDQEVDDEDGDLEEAEMGEEELMEDLEPEFTSRGDEISPNDSASQVSTQFASEEEEEEDDGENDELDESGVDQGEDELSIEAEEESLDEAQYQAEVESEAQRKVNQYLARQAELTSRRDEFQKHIAKNKWHSDELYLLDRLSKRSFEPIFPLHWHQDLPTLHPTLFGRRDEMFFNSNYTSDGSGKFIITRFPQMLTCNIAIKALMRLFDLGIRVKDLAKNSSNCVPLMFREVRQYARWSEKDGGFSKKRFIPILTIIPGKPAQDLNALLKSLRDQMDFLAKSHRDHLQLDEPRTNESGVTEYYSNPPPILYGMMLSGTLAIFETLDSSKDNATSKHIAQFDFQQDGHQVWNGLAVAMFIIMARNYLMSMLDILEDDDPESDPDL